ncbi:hypothetical protein [Burkholderia ubonensis]|uniref:hypothetical protein n=1 Tax=Burkholderia ubonensis TaxID=101571 RepID=UPI000AAF5667|nr:hypothetical protein [Burkholderia ubonensis]
MSSKENQSLLLGVFALSSICKGEAYAGYIGTHRYSSHTPLAHQLTGNHHASWIFPSKLKHQVQVLGECVGSLEDVLSWNTLLPGFCRFLRRGDAHKLRERHIGLASVNSTTLIGFGGIRAAPFESPGICLQCLREDISPSGHPFWRRDFLMRNVNFCSRHGTPIYEFCQNCAHGRGSSITLTTPQTTCVCGGPLKPRTHVKTRGANVIELDICRGWSRFLDPDFLPNVDEPYITELVHEQAWVRGLVNHQGVNWRRVHDILSPAALRDVATNIQFPFRSEATSRALRGEQSMRNPFHAVFLLVTLFGSWDAVESALQSPYSRGTAMVINEPKPGARTNRSRPPPHRRKAELKRSFAKSIARLPQTCRLYEALRDANPHLCHTQLVCLLPWSDRLAASCERLAAHGVTAIPSRKGEQYKQEIDRSLTAHIEKRRAELLAADELIRLSISRLREGHSAAVSLRYIYTRLPMAAAALQQYVDTPLTWHRRAVRSAIRAGKLATYSPADADRVDEMSLYELKRLLKRSRKYECT